MKTTIKIHTRLSELNGWRENIKMLTGCHGKVYKCEWNDERIEDGETEHNKQYDKVIRKPI